jgi:hypothetical protein
MPLCRDRAAKELSDKGYNLVRYPRANIQPLDVIAGESSPLEWLGPLTQIWAGTLAAPTAAKSKVPNFTYQRSDELKSSIGVKLLQGLISNIGGANAAANVSVSSSLSFTYQGPELYGVPPLNVGAYLKVGDLDEKNIVLKRYLEVDNATDTHFYVITEILRARKLLVRVTGSSAAALSADVSALQGLASGSASVSNQSSSVSEITFDGGVDLTFAFRAYELGYVDGEWTVIGAAPASAYLSPGSASKDTPVRFGAAPVAL